MSADVTDPGCFPTAFDPATHTIRFCRVGRADLVEAPFLDRRLTDRLPALGSIGADAAIAEQARAPDFVLHTAFCGSTLLARSLDVRGINVSLREPNVLMDLANAVRIRPPAEQARIRRALGNALALLARPFESDEHVLIKPTNSATSLYLPICEALPTARFVLLHSSLRAFLVSVIKKGEEGRHFVRTLYNIFALDGTGLGRIPQRQAMAFTDLQVAALVWRHQIETLEALRERVGATRALTLDGDAFIANPGRHLRRVRDFLGMALGDDEVDEIARSGLFRRNAKFESEEYDAGVRESESREIEGAWGTTLDLITRWGRGLVLDRPVAAPLIP